MKIIQRYIEKDLVRKNQLNNKKSGHCGPLFIYKELDFEELGVIDNRGTFFHMEEDI